MAQTSSHSKKFTVIIWLVVLVGIIAAIAIFASKKNDDVVIIEDDTEATATTSERDIVLDARIPYRTAVAPSGGANSEDIDTVEVRAQKAGDTVHLDKVVVTNSGWVAIHEATAGGELGGILGAARYDTGIWQGEVVLLRNTSAGKYYSAVVYHDDGDKEFDFKKDMIVMRDGAPVMTLFIAQ